MQETYYDLTNEAGVVTTKTASGWTVDLEAAGVASTNWEFTQDAIPSASSRTEVIADAD